MIKPLQLSNRWAELIVQLPQLKSETAHHESCQEWFPFLVCDIQLSATSRAASLLLASLSLALGRWLARGKHEADALSAVSYTLSNVLSASAACEVQARSFCFLLFHPLPQMSFLRTGWPAWFCQRQGGLCHGAVGRGQCCQLPLLQ